jgi:hypothetical protein
MGKHDEIGHHLHIPKSAKFKQPRPNAITDHTSDAPQKPKQGTLSQNMYK